MVPESGTSGGSDPIAITKGPPVTNGITTPTNQTAPAIPSTFVMTDGWYIAIACVSGVALANTRIGPLVFGILSVGLIFQLTLLLQGK